MPSYDFVYACTDTFIHVIFISSASSQNLCGTLDFAVCMYEPSHDYMQYARTYTLHACMYVCDFTRTQPHRHKPSLVKNFCLLCWLCWLKPSLVKNFCLLCWLMVKFCWFGGRPSTYVYEYIHTHTYIYTQMYNYKHPPPKNHLVVLNYTESMSDYSFSDTVFRNTHIHTHTRTRIYLIFSNSDELMVDRSFPDSNFGHIHTHMHTGIYLVFSNSAELILECSFPDSSFSNAWSSSKSWRMAFASCIFMHVCMYVCMRCAFMCNLCVYVCMCMRVCSHVHLCM